MNTMNITCINCPMGCALTVTVEGQTATNVTGNLCARGKRYAQEEIACPVRTLTTTINVDGGNRKTVAVKTSQSVPKDAILDCVAALRHVRVSAPIQTGDILVENLAGTGVNLIATGAIA